MQFTGVYFFRVYSWFGVGRRQLGTEGLGTGDGIRTGREAIPRDNYYTGVTFLYLAFYQFHQTFSISPKT